jgi:hypothetical protein
MRNEKLTKEELNELVGGITWLKSREKDINNLNQTDGCYCNYNNHAAVNNTNESVACQCHCFI